MSRIYHSIQFFEENLFSCEKLINTRGIVFGAKLYTITFFFIIYIKDTHFVMCSRILTIYGRNNHFLVYESFETKL